MKKEEIDKVLAEVSDFSKKIDALLCGDSVRFELQREVHSLKEIKVACILDEFSFINYAPECNLEYLRYETWHKQMMSFKPDIFFMETAWQGLELDWEGKISTSSKELMGIIHYCRSHNIPIVMWNKEDPVHTKKFLPIMKLGDFVFTTAAECIDFYKKELGHDRVGLLHFAAQPKYHNPIETLERKDAIAFAGAFYPRFPQRNEFLWDFIQNVENNYKVEIYDRNYYVQGTANKFPDNWKKYIMGNLSFDQIAKGYKGYKYNISLNSVTESETMFSRRVFELMASNTLVLSNFSKGMNNLFGDLVLDSDNGTRLSELLLSQDEETYRRRRLHALRSVMSGHLYEDRFSDICKFVFKTNLQPQLPNIYVYSDGAQAHPDVEKQTYKGIYFINIEDGLPKEKDAYIAFFGQEYSYDENYLYDLILATRYSDYDGYAKVSDSELTYRPISKISLKTGIIKISNIDESIILTDEFEFEGNFLAIDEFGVSHADGYSLCDEPFEFEGNGNVMFNTYPTVSVVIPTYKENMYIDHAIQSVLDQKYPSNRIKIIISVNGNNIQYYHNLISKYESNDSIRILFTDKKSAAAGRNIAIDALETECALFLDDDDYFTPGYIKELVKDYNDEVKIIIGKMNNVENKTIDEDTYINRALNKVGKGSGHEINSMNSLLATVCGKLYSSQLLKKMRRMDTTLPNTEDVVFWVDNICGIESKISLCDPNSKEAYMRRLTSNSLSRPKDEYKFCVNDRLEIIKRIETRLFDEEVDLCSKRFILNQIQSQSNFIKNFYEKSDNSIKQSIREDIISSKVLYLNYSQFGDKRGVAFCHNFSPYTDASAFVASKRLSQITVDFGSIISWNVICGNMKNARKEDSLWEMFYAKYQYTKRTVIGDKAYWSEKYQLDWGKKAFECVENEKYDVIYSRSMWVGSHIAAKYYKEKYPDTIWYAEFSDPIYMGTEGKERIVSAVGIDNIDEHFYKNIEIDVVKNADIVIFTNQNQKEYMFSKNDELKQYENKKLYVWNHPIINKNYAKIVPSQVEFNDSKINIGYFGTFYANRNHSELLRLLDDDRIDVYLFTNVTDELLGLQTVYSNLKIHDMVSSLEALNIISKMDYCYLNDIDFVDTPNPYLPSKLADYLVSAKKIIALIKEGSPLTQIKDERIIKTFLIDYKLCSSLEKQKLIKEN